MAILSIKSCECYKKLGWSENYKFKVFKNTYSSNPIKSNILFLFIFKVNNCLDKVISNFFCTFKLYSKVISVTVLKVSVLKY